MMRSFLLLIMCVFISMAGAVTRPMSPVVYGRAKSEKRSALAAVLPGDPIITGGLAAGAVTAVSIYSKVILARFALSWFPQLVTQFPILQPVFTVTEPYLSVFRSVIPPIGGFDISALPAIFCLDILGQTAAAVGAEFPAHLKKGYKGIKGKAIELRTDAKRSQRGFKAFSWAK